MVNRGSWTLETNADRDHTHEVWQHNGDYVCGLDYASDENARLIAAAPELLEALKTAMIYLEESYGSSPNHDLSMFRDAIAKAEGFTPMEEAYAASQGLK